MKRDHFTLSLDIGAARAAGRFLPGNSYSPATQFKRGEHVAPATEIKPGQRLSPATEFRPGQEAHNRLPIGAVRVRRETHTGLDRAWIKVAESAEWRKRAVVVWEAENGPVPAGMVIHHRDRDSLNDAIGNLQALTRKEHADEHRGELLAARSFTFERAHEKKKGVIDQLCIESTYRNLQYCGGRRHEFYALLQHVYVGVNEVSTGYPIFQIKLSVLQETDSCGNHAIRSSQIFGAILRKYHKGRNFLRIPNFHSSECATDILQFGPINKLVGFIIADFSKCHAYVLADVHHVDNSWVHCRRINSGDSHLVSIPFSCLICCQPNGSDQCSGCANSSDPVSPLRFIQISGEASAYQKGEDVNGNSRNIDREFHQVVANCLKGILA